MPIFSSSIAITKVGLLYFSVSFEATIPITPLCQFFDEAINILLFFDFCSIRATASSKIFSSTVCLSRFSSSIFLAIITASSKSSSIIKLTPNSGVPILPVEFILGANIKAIFDELILLEFIPETSINAFNPIFIVFFKDNNPFLTITLFSPLSSTISAIVAIQAISISSSNKMLSLSSIKA